MKKVISLLLVLCMVTAIPFAVLADTASAEALSAEARKEEILNDYRQKLFEIEATASENTAVTARSGGTDTVFEAKLAVQAEAVAELKAAGFDAYDVNPETYDNVEAVLKTDLSDAGLHEDGAYIITINEELHSHPRSVIGDTFTHTYNGTTYTLRWFTIYPSDQPVMQKTGEYRLLADTVLGDRIENCLDDTLKVTLASATRNYGTVSSLIGYTSNDFPDGARLQLDFKTTTTWTRTYTQVWDSNAEDWIYGAFVEQVLTTPRLIGSYTGANTNLPTNISVNLPNYGASSANYSNSTWRKNNGVLGYLNFRIIADSVLDVMYYRNSSVIINHEQDFYYEGAM